MHTNPFIYSQFMLYSIIFPLFFKDVRIRRITEEKNELSDQLRRLKLDLEEERTKSCLKDKSRPLSSPTSVNGSEPIGDATEWQSKIFPGLFFNFHPTSFCIPNF